MAFGPASSSPSQRLLDHAFTASTSTIWLSQVCVVTTQFEEAIAFYSGILGLSLRTVERHPLHFDRLRAVLIDADGRDVLELTETDADASPPPEQTLQRLDFRLPTRTWRALRSRLDVHEVDYDEVGAALHLTDPDGTTLRIEPLGAA